MNIIVWKNDSGAVVVKSPSPGALAILTIEQIAEKDVPPGRPYKIMDSADLPDRTFRGAWRVDDADLIDGVGGDYGRGSVNDCAAFSDGTIRIRRTGDRIEKPAKRMVAAPLSLHIDIDGAKSIAHNRRRAARDAELQPLDEEQSQARGRSNAEILADKEAILSKHDQIQIDIDAAATVEELSAIVLGLSE